MRRLAILSVAGLALSGSATAEAANRAKCDLAHGPIATAAAGKRVLVVGAARGKGKIVLISCLVTRDGKAVSPPRLLTVPSKRTIAPAALSFRGKGRGFLLISQQGGTLAAHQLGPGGGAGALGQPLPRYKRRDAGQANAACSIRNGRCLVTWASGSGSSAVVAGVRFRKVGQAGRGAFVVTGPHRDAVGGASVVASGKNFLTAWTRRAGSRSRLQGRVVRASGAPGRVFTFYTTEAPRFAAAPALAASGSRLIGAAWEEAGNLRFTVFEPGRRGELPVKVTRYRAGAGAGEPSVAYTGVGNQFDVTWPRAGNAFTRTVAFSQVRVLGRTYCLSCKRAWGEGKVTATAIAGAGPQTSATWFARGGAFISRIP